MSRCFELFCEGFHDRSFLAAWLLGRPGWRDPGKREDGTRRMVKDPISGKPVAGRGRWALEHQSGTFLQIVPAQGKPNVRIHAQRRWSDLQSDPIAGIFAVVDFDGFEPSPSVTDIARARSELTSSIRGNTQPTDSAICEVLVWHACCERTPAGVPEKQTLERLVCVALSRVHPSRSEHVQRWLDHRPDGDALSEKAFGWSHMAGWYAEHGCEDFYRFIWTNALVRQQLDELLHAAGAGRLLEVLEGENNGAGASQ